MATYIINKGEKFFKTVKSYNGAIDALRKVASDIGVNIQIVQAKEEAYFEYKGDKYSTKTFSF